jgi:DNA-binding response OmpR family regulator
MNTTHADRILKTTNALRTTLSAMLAQVDELSDLAEKVAAGAAPPPPVTVAGRTTTLRLDRSTFTVRWDGRSCALGHSMAFRLLERLARRPNEYISMDRLLEELWTGPRTYSTVRSTVCRLKVRLGEDGLRDLAERIDGRVRGHYALVLRDE